MIVVNLKVFVNLSKIFNLLYFSLICVTDLTICVMLLVKSLDVMIVSSVFSK